jgi:CRISPR/Cas system CSM-associated protein Csm3 (group 7 of RAMP superfamily)
MSRLEVVIVLRLETAFHTTGNRRAMGVDRALARGADGRPLIPATTVKGLLREAVETVLRAAGERVCQPPSPGHMCDAREPCRVCRLFGSPRLDAALRFSDAAPAEQLEPTVRSGVAISRYRRAVYQQRLFQLETTPPAPSVWRATCQGHFSTEEQAREAAALLEMAARWPFAVGGGKTRGLGWLQGMELTALVDGVPVSPSELADRWQAWGGGHVAED